MPMHKRINRRGRPEHFVSGRHLNLNDLKHEAQDVGNQYLYIGYIPDYPQPEFHVTHLKHDTAQQRLHGIKKEEGFKVAHSASNDPHQGMLLWWSLAVGPEDVKSAETRLLQQEFSDLMEDQAVMHPSFLYKFTTSPAFSERSRLGSYRFTFPLEEVLEAYRLQFCCGEQPVMRLYETVLHRQEVQHTVLVHSPASQELFSKYPLLTDDPNAVCVYKDGRFIWRPYAICHGHWYKLICRPEINRMDAEKLTSIEKVYYIWDTVAIALHVDKQVLKFEVDQLRKNLTFCDRAPVAIVPYRSFDDFSCAKVKVQRMWPDCDSPLEKECSLKQRFADLRLVLVGRTGSGKSSSGNNVLGRDAFSTGSAAAGNVQCCLQTERVFNWEVTIVDTPGLSETLEVHMEILKCINMSAPGPHAFLLVIKVGAVIDEEKDTVRQIKEIFGEDVFRRTFVVLTYGNQAERSNEILDKTKTELQKILPRSVRNRYYVLNNSQQVWDLLDEVAKMVSEH